ncbi:MAG: efflux RND transporter periplasmic adaptor subunit [Proteobacteria bacterium]|nr:efflux RND transporter periplasmic adaptor subunit [Pseudomonadota bacterium]
MRHWIAPFALAGLLVLSACGRGTNVPANGSAPALDTLVARADRAQSGRSWDATVQAVRQADLSAQTGGRVLAVNVDVGDPVEAGDVLVRLTAVEQQSGANVARAQLQAAQAAAHEAQATFDRYQALAQRQLVSRLQIDQLRASRDAAVAARDAAQAQLASASQQADYTQVRAPFAGVVQARTVQPGEAVAPGSALLSVYAPGALRAQAQVPESDAAALRVEKSVQVVLADGRQVQSSALTVFPAADPSTHSVGVRADLPTLSHPPKPGDSVRLLSSLPGGQASIWLPRSALVQRGEVSAVYVLDGTRWPELRQVRVGRRLGEQIEILAGVRDGDIVARDPVSALQALVERRQRAGGDHD